jgi:hypothetical protein
MRGGFLEDCLREKYVCTRARFYDDDVLTGRGTEGQSPTS